MMKKLSYAQALNETLSQIMAGDHNVFLIGQGVTSPWYVGSTTTGLIEKFGDHRIIDTPISEGCITGSAVGAALTGMRPIVMHPRMDFMYYGFDQIANHAANWNYMFDGQVKVPLTIWGIINRGGEQAAQHAQALQAMFVHIPGLKVIAPSTPYDLKGLLNSAVYDDNPVVFIDDRWLYDFKENVPTKLYKIPFGKAAVRRPGKDITIIANSFLTHESLKAANSLKRLGIDAEVIDLRTLKPLDYDLIMDSIIKTRKAAVVDGGWRTCGLGAEIAASITEQAFSILTDPVLRISLPDAPAPSSSVLEKIYYPKARSIALSIRKYLKKGK
jgi:acetoin:2,6-dichlorophenolindophenol oxidoreductase subunit beta